MSARYTRGYLTPWGSFVLPPLSAHSPKPKDGCAAALAPVPHPIASYRYPVLKPLVNLVPTNIVLTWYRLSLLHAVL